jgi:hypothetical protein
MHQSISTDKVTSNMAILTFSNQIETVQKDRQSTNGK